MSMKKEINSNTIRVGDFNTPLTTMDRSTKQKINKETQTLKDTMDQLDLIDIYRTFHPKTINFTFFSSAHGTFSRIDHILGHKSSLSKFKKIEIIPVISSDHSAVRSDLNYSHFIIAYGFRGSGIQRQPSRDGLSLLHKVWGLSERRLIWLGDGSSVGFCTGMSGASP